MSTFNANNPMQQDQNSLSNLAEQKVVCPHCWNTFYPDQAHYISSHAELVGDPVAGDFEQTRFAPNQTTRDREGHALDPKGSRMVDRACPRCHLQVPRDLLLQRPIFLSVVGAPRSGKTYFLTSMIHELRRELSRFLGFSLLDADSYDVKAFLQYESALFFNSDPNSLTFLKKTEESGGLYNRVRLDGGEVVLPKPFIFSLRPTDTNIDLPKYGRRLFRELVLYDNAGESFEHLKEKFGERVTQHLGEASTVLFTYDPLQDSAARQKLASLSSDPQLNVAAHSYQQDLILNETIHRIRRHRNLDSGKRLPVDLAICVMKYDVWKPLLPWATKGPSIDGTPVESDPIDHTSVELDPNAPVGRFDVDEVNRISLLVRAFVEDISPSFVATAESNFRTVRYFPVSALGGSPEMDAAQTVNAEVGSSGNPLKVRPSSVQPFRASHPMLWVLQRENLIRKVHSNPSAITNLPKAELKHFSGDRIWVTTPHGNHTLVLDFEYAGRWIVDPFSGARIAIPARPNTPITSAAPPAAPAQPVQKGAAAAHPLTLPEQPPKKGWFKR